MGIDPSDSRGANITSVTEETSLEAFLRTAELAGTDFTAGEMKV